MCSLTSRRSQSRQISKTEIMFAHEMKVGVFISTVFQSNRVCTAKGLSELKKMCFYDYHVFMLILPCSDILNQASGQLRTLCVPACPGSLIFCLYFVIIDKLQNEYLLNTPGV